MAKETTDFLIKVGQLKNLDRTGWVLKNIDNPETVSGHMYRMALIAMFGLSKETRESIDVNKLVQLCLVHDIAECIVGDITPYDGVPIEEKFQKELDAVIQLGKLLPPDLNDNLKELWNEYEDRKTLESILTKEIDLYDLILQAYEYEKKQFEQYGKAPKMDEFFNVQKIINKVKNKDIKLLVDEVLKRRKILLEKYLK